MKRIFFLFLTFTIIGSSFGQKNQMFPTNELYKDSSLTDFICKLQYAIFKKDKSFLLSVVDEHVKNSFGGDDGMEEFKQIWELDSVNSSIWFYLSKLISLGGKFSDNMAKNNSTPSFVFPYLFFMKLPSPYDSLEDDPSIVIVTDSSVSVLEKPELESKILYKLHYDVVKVNFEKSYPQFQSERLQDVTYYGEKEWYYITSLDNKMQGYVFCNNIWSPYGYRLRLNKINGKWKITSLISGD